MSDIIHNIPEVWLKKYKTEKTGINTIVDAPHVTSKSNQIERNNFTKVRKTGLH